MALTDQIQANREKWAEALESGIYEQVQQALVLPHPGGIPNPKTHSMCCLGVAQHVFEPELWQVGQAMALNAGLGAYCSYRVSQMLGLNEDDVKRFVDMNDNQEFSFARIAAEVRSLPPVEPSKPLRGIDLGFGPY